MQDLQLAFYAEASKRGWAREVQLPRFSPAPTRNRAGGNACDVVLNGITGSTGLAPTLAALEAGSILRWPTRSPWSSAVRWSPGPPARSTVAVDSEHSALAQCLRGGSAGRGRPADSHRQRRAVPRSNPEQLADVTPAEALAHPTWDMGRVITTNSATLVNKGLELLEAHLSMASTWTGSTSSSIRSRSCTRWCSSWTARRWPSARRRT